MSTTTINIIHFEGSVNTENKELGFPVQENPVVLSERKLAAISGEPLEASGGGVTSSAA